MELLLFQIDVSLVAHCRSHGEETGLRGRVREGKGRDFSERRLLQLDSILKGLSGLVKVALLKVDAANVVLDLGNLEVAVLDVFLQNEVLGIGLPHGERFVEDLE